MPIFKIRANKEYIPMNYHKIKLAPHGLSLPKKLEIYLIFRIKFYKMRPKKFQTIKQMLINRILNQININKCKCNVHTLKEHKITFKAELQFISSIK